MLARRCCRRRSAEAARLYRALTITEQVHVICSTFPENAVMVSAVNNSPSVLAPPQAQPPSSSSSTGASFQQAVNQYMQNTTSGAGGGTGANPTQALSSDVMSSLMQMQS
jgi:hypothetical protein